MAGSTALALIVLLAATPASAPKPGDARAELLGRWRGVSLCVKEPWNSACNDEQVLYDFRRTPGQAAHVTLDAYKYVNGEPALMGTMDFTRAPEAHTWHSFFSNARVRIRWVFEARGDSLIGRCEDLKQGRLARNARASRVRTP